MLLEVCANSLQSALVAQRAGADRIELCAELGIGGISPSFGTLKLVRDRLDLPIHVLIRPRSGHFCYTDLEFDAMLADIGACAELGVAGIVCGALLEDFSLDVERTKILVERAAPMHFCFHRAFDWISEPLRALEQLERMGVDTVLSSGGQPTALEGLGALERYQRSTSMDIMAGGGITAAQVSAFRDIGLRAVHSSGTSFSKALDLTGKIPLNSPLHLAEDRVGSTDLGKIQTLVQAVKET